MTNASCITFFFFLFVAPTLQCIEFMSFENSVEPRCFLML